MVEKLHYTQLKKFVNEETLSFSDTREVTPVYNIIGQDQGRKSLEFGLKVKDKGYNIYVSGASGTGKTSFSYKYASEIAKNEPIPPDLCYVYNFENPKKPILLEIEGGLGKEFKEDIDETISFLREEIPRVNNDKSFEDKKNSIVREFQKNKDQIMINMSEEVKDENFGLKTTSTGIYLMPIIDGEIISEEEFEQLPQDVKVDVMKNSENIQYKATEVIRFIKEEEKILQRKVEDLDYGKYVFAVGKHITSLIEKYSFLKNEKLNKYLFALKEDILDNIESFFEAEAEDESIQSMLPWMIKNDDEDYLIKYSVNLIVDNSELTGAPVIKVYNPTYSDLVGKIEYDSENGNYITDFTKIKAGLFHKAQGGYIILQAYDILDNAMTYEAIRKFLQSGKLSIEPCHDNYALTAVTGLQPEKLKGNLKIIMVGSNYYYDLINYYDDNFFKYFKIISQFDYETTDSEDYCRNFCGFVKKFVLDKNSLEFHRSAVAKLLEYSTVIAGNQNKMSTVFGEITDILIESNAWAEIDGKEIVTKEYIEKAIFEKRQRENLYEQKLSEYIKDEIILIETTGEKVGQINGLAVLDNSDYAFGKPSRITATTFLGVAGVVNIEKEADMSGETHNKGVEILSGYLGHMYAQDFPLCLTCKICFEQNYSGIDGDSASSTELYAILSSLSGVPIKQNIAVTGSLNQFGEIQAIGGATAKIEGFFDLCKERGLTGDQGVIIPVQNKQDLVLKDEVVEASKAGLFTIYTIENIDDGIEILTGVKAGIRDEFGKYEKDSIHYLVYKKLKQYYKKAKAGKGKGKNKKS